MSNIYLSGPMDGMPKHNFPAFHAEAVRLRALGHWVVNPVEINPDQNRSREECLRNDLFWMMRCDTLALLDGWERSRGALFEMHVAQETGIGIVMAKDIRK